MSLSLLIYVHFKLFESDSVRSNFHNNTRYRFEIFSINRCIDIMVYWGLSNLLSFRMKIVTKTLFSIYLKKGKGKEFVIS